MAPVKILNIKANTAILEEKKSLNLSSPWKNNPMSVENFYTLGESYVEALNEKAEDIEVNEEDKPENKPEDKYTKILKNLE